MLRGQDDKDLLQDKELLQGKGQQNQDGDAKKQKQAKKPDNPGGGGSGGDCAARAVLHQSVQRTLPVVPRSDSEALR